MLNYRGRMRAHQVGPAKYRETFWGGYLVRPTYSLVDTVWGARMVATAWSTGMVGHASESVRVLEAVQLTSLLHTRHISPTKLGSRIAAVWQAVCGEGIYAPQTASRNARPHAHFRPCARAPHVESGRVRGLSTPHSQRTWSGIM